MSWIHIQDLVRLFHHVLSHDHAAGAINGVAPEPVTNGQFTSELGRILHRPTCIPIPAWGLRLALGEMATVLLASQRVLPVRGEALGFQWRFPRLGGALADICSDLSEEFEREDWIPRPIDEVFPFFADAYNLQKITPPFLNFRVLGTSAPEMAEGLMIRYRLSVRGIPMNWQSRIESWEPGRRFVDRQVRGPYRLWHHTHEFEPYEGGTIVRDRVRYELPLSPFGDIVAGRFVARDVGAIFDYRRGRTRELFGVAESPT
jgi:ligand-binding SRPBCC domain-containing protein